MTKISKKYSAISLLLRCSWKISLAVAVGLLCTNIFLAISTNILLIIALPTLIAIAIAIGHSLFKDKYKDNLEEERTGTEYSKTVNKTIESSVIKGIFSFGDYLYTFSSYVLLLGAFVSTTVLAVAVSAWCTFFVISILQDIFSYINIPGREIIENTEPDINVITINETDLEEIGYIPTLDIPQPDAQDPTLPENRIAQEATL